MALLGAAYILSNLDLSKLLVSIGGLGTAAYGVVDATKGFGGGISNRGFRDIKNVVSKLIPADLGDSSASGLALPSAVETLRANWLNGVALVDQKSIAKALVKLSLTGTSARQMAATAGVDPEILTSIARKLATGEPLVQKESDVYGRFDLSLTALLDQGYQRGDQRYRDSAKLLAVPIAVALALLGVWAIDGSSITFTDAWRGFFAGLMATPLAPVAKDLSSTIQAGAKLAQSWRK